MGVNLERVSRSPVPRFDQEAGHELYALGVPVRGHPLLADASLMGPDDDKTYDEWVRWKRARDDTPT